MKLQTKIIFFTGVVIGIPGILIYLANNMNPLTHSETTANIARNDNSETEESRIWKTIQWSEPVDINTINSKELYNPIGITGTENNLIVTDWTIQRIALLDKHGQFLDYIGKPSGRGPGEMIGISDIYPFHNKIWITDSRKRELLQYTTSGEFINSFVVEDEVFKIAVTDDYIYTHLFGNEYLIKKYDWEGNVIKSFGKVIEDQMINRFAVFGNIFAHDNFIVYLPKYVSTIYVFDLDGNLVNTVQTHDNQTFPGLNQRGSSTLLSPKVDVEYNDYQVIGDTLFVKAYRKTGDHHLERYDFIDVYRISDSMVTYLYSFETPVKALTFGIVDGTYFFTEYFIQELKKFEIISAQ